MNWINVAQGCVLVNTIINFGFHKRRGTGSAVVDVPASEHGFCTVALVIWTTCMKLKDRIQRKPMSHSVLLVL